MKRLDERSINGRLRCGEAFAYLRKNKGVSLNAYTIRGGTKATYIGAGLSFDNFVVSIATSDGKTLLVPMRTISKIEIEGEDITIISN